MTSNNGQRRLVAIMFADIVGYTALTAQSAEAGLRVRKRHRSVLRPVVERCHGEWIDETGDESLCCFPSALDAVNCALTVQAALKDDPELRLRIGIHLGDVLFEEGRVYGDGVNVASRLRPLAEPGGICVSGEVYHAVRNHDNVQATSLGNRVLKNVGRPMDVFALSGTPEPVGSAAPPLAPVLRILICDDHAVFREGLQSVLSEFDAELLQASDCDEAIKRVETETGINLVLLDLSMPGTDGWTALRKLRESHPALTVVIVSASEEPRDVRAALDAGASGFIPKSSSPEVLRQAVRLILSGGVYIPRQALEGQPPEDHTTTPRSRKRRVAGLTPRQIEVLNLMRRGLTNKEIGGVLGIAETTVKAHISAILGALDVSNRTEAVLMSRDLDLEPGPE